jgi:hypothetical protein
MELSSDFITFSTVWDLSMPVEFDMTATVGGNSVWLERGEGLRI